MSDVNRQIVEYIKNALNQDHDIVQIRNFLIQNNISSNDVDTAIDFIYGNNIANNTNNNLNNTSQNLTAQNTSNRDQYSNKSIKASNQINPQTILQIKDYVRTQLNNGYDSKLIRTALINHGFDSETVEQIIIEIETSRNFSLNQLNTQIKYNNNNYANQSEDNNNTNNNSASNINNQMTVKHEVHVSGKAVALIFGIIILVAAFFAFSQMNLFNNSNDKGTALLDVTVAIDKELYAPGDKLQYTVSTINMGTTKRVDSIAKYIIVDELDQIITSKQESLAIETRSSSNGFIQIPEDTKQGRYYLKVLIDYAYQAPSTVSFRVQEKTNNNEKNNSINNESTTNVDETLVNEETNSYVPPIVKPSVSNSTATNNQKTFGDAITIIRLQAKINPNNVDCNKFTTSEQKDVCLITVAEESNKVAFCDKINLTTHRDDCYLRFVLLGNSDICNKIKDNSTAELCNQVNILNQITFYAKSNQTDKILELNRQFNPAAYSTNIKPATYQSIYNQNISISDFIFSNEELTQYINETNNSTPLN